MDTLDTSARAGIALLLTLALLAVAWVAWRRRGPASGLRWLGVALLPVAAWLTGTLRLVVDVSGDVSRYVSRLVLSPAVWAGVVVLALAVALIATGSALRTRGIGVRRGARTSRPGGGDRPAELSRGGAKQAPPAADDAGLDDDVSAILRRRGIS